MANTANVGAGKPKIAGAISMAALSDSLVLPTDVAETTPTGFTSLGFVSEDGVGNSNSPETEETKTWGGAIAMTTQSGKPDTFTFTLIEATNEDVLKLVYGESNVETKSSTTVVKATTDEAVAHAFCVIMVINGKNKTIVIPNAKVSEVGDITYNDSDAVGYEITLTAFPDPAVTTQEITHYEYIA